MRISDWSSDVCSSDLCEGILELVDRHPDIHVLYPVHPNPNVRIQAREMLGMHPAITLCEPLEYLAFVAAMKRATLILTDSGGGQEEAHATGRASCGERGRQHV